MPRALCIGAGPAGLTAAYFLTQAGWDVTIIESDPHYVGGLARTVRHEGYGFDIGGHRFFSKSKEVEQLWKTILADDLLVRERKSRIYFRGKFYPYPLQVWRTLMNLGILEAVLCLLSYMRRAIRPITPENDFEAWVTNRFGTRLYDMFFKTYTEKVWGIPCTDISADWAAQRINGFSLAQAVLGALFGNSRAKTLTKQFYYPRRGPGMMWEKMAERVREQGGAIRMQTNAKKLTHDKGKREWHVACDSAAGPVTFTVDHVISSMPLKHLAMALKDHLPPPSRRAAEGLRYRDFIIVALVARERNRFDDQWLYIHDQGVKVGRIQNFRAWSEAMVPDGQHACYGMEYFCFDGDGLWESSDQQLVALASAELVKLGLADASDIVQGTVVRQPKAYPVYDQEYLEHVGVLRAELEAYCPGVHVVGRNGMHKYNNQDHSMMTAMLTVRNLLAGERIYDVWGVNQDAEYHEAPTPGRAQAA